MHTSDWMQGRTFALHDNRIAEPRLQGLAAVIAARRAVYLLAHDGRAYRSMRTETGGAPGRHPMVASIIVIAKETSHGNVSALFKFGANGTTLGGYSATKAVVKKSAQLAVTSKCEWCGTRSNALYPVCPACGRMKKDP